MSIYTTIKEDATTALKNKDAERRIIYQTILTALKNKAIEVKTPDSLTDEQAQEVLSKLAKQNNESIAYCAMWKTDKMKRLVTEREILSRYLPKQLTEKEIRDIITTVLASLGITEPTSKSKGIIMKVLMPQIKGKADGKQVNEILETFFADKNKSK